MNLRKKFHPVDSLEHLGKYVPAVEDSVPGQYWSLEIEVDEDGEECGAFEIGTRGTYQRVATDDGEAITFTSDPEGYFPNHVDEITVNDDFAGRAIQVYTRKEIPAA